MPKKNPAQHHAGGAGCPFRIALSGLRVTGSGNTKGESRTRSRGFLWEGTRRV